MKIAYVITRSDEVGGAHIHVKDLTCWVKEKGHEVRVFVGGSGIFSDMLTQLDIPVRSLNFLQRSISPLKDLLAIFELRRTLMDFSPDLVSIHSAKAGLVARIACLLLQIPFVFTAHGWSFARGKEGIRKKIFLSIERCLCPLTDKVIVVCENDAQFAIENSICKKADLITIHNGMPEIMQRFISKPSNMIPNIIMVARFEYPKNHKQLIEALANIKDLSWKLTLVGDGPLTEAIQKYSHEMNVADRIVFLGRRQDIAELLSDSDIFVLTTFWEGFPRSIIEATRAGLPVIASDVAGIPEAVLDNITGYLIPVNDTAALTEKLRQLILQPELRLILGKNGREQYCKYFNFEITAKKTYAVYEEVLSR